MATKKMDVPDIGNLLSSISKKRDSGELPPTEIQRVQPVEPAKSKAGKTEKQENAKPVKPEARGPGGRPTTKDPLKKHEYVKLSPRIHEALKKAVEHALTDEIFQDKHGRPIKTIDGIVEFALEELLKRK